MDIKSILRQNEFRFNKQFGQNFLTDESLLNEIVALSGITNQDTVLEIGAGAGTLTRSISKVAHKVIAFEIDRNLKDILAVTLGEFDNCQLVMADIMKQNIEQIESQYTDNSPYKVVANIPYYITTPLIMKFIEGSELVESLTLTIQKEVADRLCADANNKEYGAITVAVQSVADVSLIKDLPRNLFFPAPNVDSAVVHIEMNRNKFDIADKAMFNKVTRCAFAMRRKTLVNNLLNTFKKDRQTIENLLTELDLPLTVRGEALTVQQIVDLSNAITRHSW